MEGEVGPGPHDRTPLGEQVGMSLPQDLFLGSLRQSKEPKGYKETNSHGRRGKKKKNGNERPREIRLDSGLDLYRDRWDR